MTLNAQFLMLLIFAHLMVDYVFQTTNISVKKSKSVKGIVIHGSIVFLGSTIILSIYGLFGFFAALIISVSHFIIDFAKMKTKKYFKFNTHQYLLDQLLHLLVIVAFAYIFGELVPTPIIKLNVVRVLNYAIVVTYVATVFSKTVLLDMYGAELASKGFFIKYERIFDSSIVIIIACFFVKAIAGTIAILVGGVVFYYVEREYFKYKSLQILIKAGIYFMIAFCFKFLINF